eukprot:scaffold1.g5895.t1
MSLSLLALLAGRGTGRAARLPSFAIFPPLRALDTLRSHVHTQAAAYDTIFALSSGSGRAAVALIRLSGPAAGEDCVELHLHGGPAVVRAVLDALPRAAPRLRPALPGEFSRRAFELGKLDLTEVEGLADLLAAETEAQRRQALAHSGGAARRQFEAWRAALLGCLARVEAVIDFGEDEGIADDVAAGVVEHARQLRQELQRHLASARRALRRWQGELVRVGVRVAIVGPPNAGKSSLLNALAGREAAIVSPVAGTTRDVVEVALELGGYKVVVSDSAGIRATQDPIEAEGVARARRSALVADVVVVVEDASATGGATAAAPSLLARGWVSGLLRVTPKGRAAAFLWLHNKVDLLPPGERPAQGQVERQQQQRQGMQLHSAAVQQGQGGQQQAAGAAQQHQSAQHQEQRLVVERTGGGLTVHAEEAEKGGQAGESGAGAAPTAPPAPRPLRVSCHTGEGLDAFLEALQCEVAKAVGGGGDPAATALVTRARHRHHLGACVEALRRYEAAPVELELAAEELRGAARALGAVTGALDTEAVLDSLFAEFCIGK